MQQEKTVVTPKNGPSNKGTESKGTESSVVAPAKVPSTGEKRLSKDEIRAAIREYDKVNAEMVATQTRLLDLKRQRSKIVQSIYEGSPDTKSFRFQRTPGAEPEVLVIMSREDKNEKSPSFGERFYHFRKPGVPEPFDL